MCCTPRTPKGIVKMLARIGFGLALVFAGIAHYQDSTFATMVGGGLGVLSSLGMVWGYILPLLMIVGGVLLAIGLFPVVAAWTAGLALASIPAGVLLKSVMSGVPLSDTMPAAMNAYVWLIMLLLVKPKGGCGSFGGACCPSNGACACDMPMAAPAKSIPTKPFAMMKAAPKKVTKKK